VPLQPRTGYSVTFSATLTGHFGRSVHG
jgi:hypothetical protein